MVKLRLQRHGRKGKPFYHIVAADARAPRDGRYIERIGSYNPNTNPATIDLNLDDAVRWLGNGAVPTDTCRAILSYKGALYKHHLNGGVRKGAFSQDDADKKFASWLEEKQSKINAKREGILTAEQEKLAESFKREQAVREAKEKAIMEKNSPVAEDAIADAEGSAEAPAEGEVPVADATADAPAAEEVAEAPAADEAPAAEETPAEEAPEAKEENA